MNPSPSRRLGEQNYLLHHYEEDESSDEDHASLADAFQTDKVPPSHSCRGIKKYRNKILAFSCIVAAAIVVAFASLIWKTRVQSRPTTPAYARLRDETDYVLDPEWDFDEEPRQREYRWTIGDAILNPDGVSRPMLLINNLFPGPLIECNEGDEIIVHVNNRGSNATSIHWHGLYQNGTNWMDGTVGVTQCPIAPGHSFTYRFNVSGQSGSYFYHSHMSMQASDGLTGPLIIHPRGQSMDPPSHLRYSQDRVVMLSDHYYDPSHQLLMRYLATDSENDEPVPNSALINGRNQRDCADLPRRNCSAKDIRQARFDLASRKATRLRIINAGVFAEFSLQIDEHEFDIVEVDGVEVVPQSIHRLNINPAQRYSILLKPPRDDRKDLYWMRARMITHCFAYEEPELQEEVRAIISYKSPDSPGLGRPKDGDDGLPQSRDWPEIIEVECRDLNTSSLEPLIAMPAPTAVDHALYFRSSFQIREWALSRGYLNESSFRSNAAAPILDTALRGFDASTALESVPDGIDDVRFDTSTQLVYRTTGVSTVDILIQNFDDGNHPFHLHGYKFWVMAQGHGYPPPPAELYASLNVTNPLRRDVASVEAFGWTLLRFVADNPGAWAFHCHIGWHTEAGLMMVFANRIEAMASLSIPADVKELCKIEGMQRGATPPDSLWYGNHGQMSN